MAVKILFLPQHTLDIGQFLWIMAGKLVDNPFIKGITALGHLFLWRFGGAVKNTQTRVLDVELSFITI